MQPAQRRNVALNIFSLLLIISCILLVFWALNRWLGRTDNLIQEAGFENELTGWQFVENNGTVLRKAAVDDISNNVLALGIPRSEVDTWVAARTQLDTVSPGQDYTLSMDYRLPYLGRSPAKVILRVDQFDNAHNLIRQDDISDPNSLETVSDEAGQPAWRSLNHRFTPDENMHRVEISIALFGNQTTDIEVDNVVLAPETGAGVSTNLRAGLIALLVGAAAAGLVYYGHLRYRQQVQQGVKWGAVAAVNIVIFIVFAEIVALGIYFIRDGQLFYTNKRQYELIGISEQGGGPDNQLTGNLASRRIHPFFGFVVKPGIDRRFNNYGLISAEDYPYIKEDEDQYIVGIFGGSVAENFAQAENRARFIDNLKRIDVFDDKEIVVLNFAAGAYKQPQQLMLLNYFLSIGQQFDMVINIDGFNEASMSYINFQDGVDISMPVSYIMLPLVNLTNQTTPSPQTIESLASINRDRTTLNNLARTINESGIAFTTFILEQYYNYVFNNYRAELATLEQIRSDTFTSLVYLNPSDKAADQPLVFEAIAAGWANSSILMHEILTSRDIPYFHFLQPNQYYSGKVFSDQELKIAINPNQISKVGVEGVYPVLVDKFALLEQRGVNFHSGLEIFDNETGVVYGE